MVDLSLSLDEENFIANTSRDAEFARKLFGDLNRNILKPPGNDEVIILNDSDEEKEALDEMASTELVATSAAINPVSTASAAADDAPEGAKNDNSNDQGPN
jgi:hypothetical protein